MNDISKNGKTITVGLLWHSVNSTNLGVGALTASNISIVEKVAGEIGVDVRFKIIGWSDPERAYISGDNIEICPIRARHLVSPNGLMKTLRDCQIVLDISAGDSFADIYGALRFVFNILAKANAVLAMRPLILSPQTIGPFERWWAKIAAGFFMARARHVITRDRLSTDFLKQFNLGSNTAEATDVAFRLPYDKPKSKVDDKIDVGLNISGLLFNGGYSKDNMFSLQSDYPELVRNLIKRFGAIESCRIHLIGHVNSERQAVEDDYRVAQLLSEEFPETILAPRFENPSAAKSYIAGMDFFSGSRMHACIAAFSSGVPVLPMAYSRKFAGLFGTLGYDHLADCRTQSAGDIIEAVIAAFEARATLKSDLEIGLLEAEKKLMVYENILSQSLKELRDG